MPEWLMGTDCKSVSIAYVGSNPTRPNSNKYNLYESQDLGKVILNFSLYTFKKLKFKL